MRKRELKNVEWSLLIVAIILCTIGLVALFSATQSTDYDEFNKQCIWLIVSLVIMGAIMLIDYETLIKISPILYGIFIILLIAVLFTSPVNGATSWFDIGFFSFQPGEFAKVFVILFLALAISKIQERNKSDINKPTRLLILLAILLIIVIVAINYIWKDNGKAKKDNANSTKVLADTNIIEENTNQNSDLEQKLKKILSNISGVGEVEVLITYSQTSVVNPIYNEDYGESVTEEEDTSGGKRKVSSTTNKKEVVSSNNDVITQSVTSPQIQGAVVIAKGAGDANVKANIIQAVEAATGLSTYKIQVFEMN